MVHSIGKRYLAALVAVAAVFCLLSGCLFKGGSVVPETAEEEPVGVSPGQPMAMAYAVDDIFSLNYTSQNSLNPITTRSSLNMMFGSLMYESMFEVDEKFDYVPVLVTDFSSEDGLTWFFTVDTGILMHDGTTLTAYDVVYSIQRAQRTTAYGPRLGIIYGISAMDSEFIMVTLKYPNFRFPALLNIPVLKSGSLNDGVPVGTGPYALNPEEMRLEKFASHRDADKMPLDVIYLKEFPAAEDAIAAYEDSLIDLVVNDPTGTSNLGYGSSNEIRKFNTGSMQFVGFNLDNGFLMFSSHRYALNYAVNRDFIVKDTMSGYGVATALPVNPASSVFSAALDYKCNKYNLELCRTVLESLNVKDHDGDGFLEYVVAGIPLDLELDFIVNNDNGIKLTAARKIADDLESIGVSVNLRELPWGEYTAALAAGDFDMYYGEVKLTADFDLTCMLTEEGALNYGNITDPHYGALIGNYLTAQDEGRQKAMEELCEYIYNTAPILPICFECQEVLTHRGVVSGMTPTQYDVFYKFEEWTINLE